MSAFSADISKGVRWRRMSWCPTGGSIEAEAVSNDNNNDNNNNHDDDDDDDDDDGENIMVQTKDRSLRKEVDEEVDE